MNIFSHLLFKKKLSYLIELMLVTKVSVWVGSEANWFAGEVKEKITRVAQY